MERDEGLRKPACTLPGPADLLPCPSLPAPPPFSLRPPPRVPLLFHHLVGRDEQEQSSPSWYNLDEAKQVGAEAAGWVGGRLKGCWGVCCHTGSCHTWSGLRAHPCALLCYQSATLRKVCATFMSACVAHTDT